MSFSGSVTSNMLALVLTSNVILMADALVCDQRSSDSDCYRTDVNDNIIVCHASWSCYSSQISASELVWCLASQSCAYSSLVEAPRIYCDGYSSCYGLASLTSDVLNCRSTTACSNIASLTSDELYCSASHACSEIQRVYTRVLWASGDHAFVESNAYNIKNEIAGVTGIYNFYGSFAGQDSHVYCLYGGCQVNCVGNGCLDLSLHVFDEELENVSIYPSCCESQRRWGGRCHDTDCPDIVIGLGAIALSQLKSIDEYELYNIIQTPNNTTDFSNNNDGKKSEKKQFQPSVDEAFIGPAIDDHTASGRNRIALIFTYFMVSVIFLMLGLFIGAKCQHRYVKDEQLDV